MFSNQELMITPETATESKAGFVSEMVDNTRMFSKVNFELHFLLPHIPILNTFKNDFQQNKF